MNYGKTAYLKVLDLEKELSHNEDEATNFNSYLEIVKPSLNETFSHQYKTTIDLPDISVESDKTICFQIKATLNTNVSAPVHLELTIDDLIIHEESKKLTAGENDFVVFKTFTPITTKQVKTSITLSTTQENASITLAKLNIIVLGASGDSVSYEVEMRAIELKSQSKALLSYVDSEKLYFKFADLAPVSLKGSDFTYLLPAISHAFCLQNYESETNTNPPINLYRVDPSGNLYVSQPFESNITERLIDTQVQIVHACVSPTITEDSNVVAYIKNGACYYITTKGATYTNPKKLSLPQGSYTDIRVISNSDSDFVYILASHENGSNYILRSVIEVSTGNLIEHLDLSYNILITKYIDLATALKNSTETLNLNITSIIKGFVDFESVFKRTENENVSLTYSLTPSKYTVEFDGIYGIKLDKSILTPGQWESYTDDAEGLEGAYMDFDNDVFVDNGWKDRWPFNKMRPCLLKDGVVVGYLNPDNYALFEDGTTANITNRTYGNVMIEIPKIYYKLTSNDQYITVQISRKAREGFTDQAFWHNGVDNSKIYVGAYLSADSYLTTRGFYSISNCLLNDLYALNYDKFYSYKEKRNPANFEFLPFSVLTLIQCLYLIMFKNTNSQASLGYGMNVAKTKYRTGTLNTKGMYYGTKEAGGGVKCFGFEDLYGVKMTIVTGLYIDSSGYPRYIDNYSKDSSYNPSFLSDYAYPPNGFTFVSPFSGNILQDITGINELGFMDQSSISDTTSGFTDNVYPRKGTTSVTYGLTSYNDACGIFNMNTVLASSQDSKRSIRLVYYPDNT